MNLTADAAQEILDEAEGWFDEQLRQYFSEAVIHLRPRCKSFEGPVEEHFQALNMAVKGLKFLDSLMSLDDRSLDWRGLEHKTPLRKKVIITYKKLLELLDQIYPNRNWARKIDDS